jgi:hypothetical protein
MNLMEQQTTKGSLECAKTRIYHLFTQCIQDIENTASVSGLSMRDLGIDVEKYSSAGNSCIIELKLSM